MQKAKRVKSGIIILFAAAILYCISALTVLAADKVVVTDKGAEFPLGTWEKDEVKLFIYTVQSEEKEVGKVELRYGDTRSQGKMLWINERQIQDFTVDTRNKKLIVPLETWISFFGEQGTYTYQTSETVLKPNLDPVASISWNNSGWLCINWNKDEKATEKIYDFRVYRNDVFVSNMQVKRPGPEEMIQNVNVSDRINESGCYTVSMAAVGNKEIGDSKEIYSGKYDYNVPKDADGNEIRGEKIKELRWKASSEDETLPTIIEWDSVTGVCAYHVHLVVYQTLDQNQGKQIMSSYGSRVQNKNDVSQPFRYDWSYVIKNWEGKAGVSYEASVQPLSYDIEKVANAPATIQDEYKISTEIKEMQTILKDATVDNVMEVVERLGIESAALAIQTDSDVLEKIEELEEQYLEINSNIHKAEPNVSPSLLNVLNEKDISYVGAAISAVSGSTVSLNFTEVSDEAKKQINDVLYQNAVQVDISIDGVSGNLKCPVTITMVPPKGVLLSKLVLLHYHKDGSYERIYPVFCPDGRIRFSVTSFSTFVFAEMVSYTEQVSPAPPADTEKPSDTNKPSSGNNGTQGSDSYDDNSDNSDSSSVSSSVVGTRIRTYGADRKFMKADGAFAKSEWVKKGNVWYYAGADGILKTGWYRNETGVWYYLKDTCEMATGWQMIDSKWYFLDLVNGDMKTGWLQTADGKWYFLNAEGDMQTGWICTADSKWYYLGTDGACLMDTTTPDGYQVDANGAWIQ